MIEDANQLEYSVSCLARMYSLCERIAADTTGDPATREDEVEGVRIMVRKIEREVAEFLGQKYGLLHAAAPAGPTDGEVDERMDQEQAARAA